MTLLIIAVSVRSTSVAADITIVPCATGAVSCDLPDIELGRDALAGHSTSLSWQNVDVVTKGGIKKIIVHQSFGKMRSGEMAAILGPSGKLH